MQEPQLVSDDEVLVPVAVQVPKGGMPAFDAVEGELNR